MFEIKQKLNDSFDVDQFPINVLMEWAIILKQLLKWQMQKAAANGQLFSIVQQQHQLKS